MNQVGHSGVTPTPLSLNAFTSIFSESPQTSTLPNKQAISIVESRPIDVNQPRGTTAVGLNQFTNNAIQDDSPLFTPNTLLATELASTPNLASMQQVSQQMVHNMHHQAPQLIHQQPQIIHPMDHHGLASFNFGNKLPNLMQQNPGAFSMENPSFNVNVPYIQLPGGYYETPQSGGSGVETSPSSPMSGECLPAGTFMAVIQGFNLDDGVPEECGGKDNRKTLTTHVVRVKVASLLEKHPLPANKHYMVNCVLLGYKRYEKEEIAPLESKEIIVKDRAPESEDFTFDNIVVKHTSHSNGQKLFLRFKLCLVDDRGEEKVIEELDTTYFKTVTKRAIIKRQNTKKLDDQKKKVTKLIGVEPKYSITNGGQLIKILTDNMPEKVRLQTLIVKFGEKKARRVHSARDNTIICETPEYPKGDGVPISISLDSGVTFFQSPTVKMSFVDPSTDGLPEVTPQSKTFVVNFAAAGGSKHGKEEEDEHDLSPKKKKKK